QPAITDPLLDRRHQPIMRNRLKTRGDIRLHHPTPAPLGLIDQDLEGIVRRALWRNPNEHSRKSASKIGSMTAFTAACTMRSRTAGIESGRSSSRPGFGMKT